jgi:ribose transport system substrate-binding protein
MKDELKRTAMPSARRPGMRQVSAAVAALAAASAIAACGSSSSSSTTSSSAASASGTSSGSSGPGGGSAAQAALAPYVSTPTKINVTTPLKAAPPAGKTVVFMGTNNPSNVLVQQGVQKLAALAHWNYSLVTYDPANPGTLTAAITTALAKHPQYITEAGNPLTPSQLSTIQKGGAKVVLNSVYPVTVAPPVIAQTDSATQDALMGKIIADYFVSDSGGKGNAVIEHVPAYPILDAFTNSFQAEVTKQCPACKTSITNVTIPQLTAGQVPSVLVSALRSNSSAKYLVFDDGPFADGVTSALAAAGLSGVKVIGEAADNAGVSALKTGKEQAWTGYDPSYQAYLAMDAMFRDAEGLPIPLTQEATQPTQLLTKTTVGHITAWSAPANPLPQFQALWKIQ